MLEELKYHHSIQNYNKVLKISNELLRKEEYAYDYEILTYKAEALRNTFQDQKAIEIFKLIINHYPENIHSKINISICLMDIGEFLEAKEHLGIAKEIDPENLDVICNLIFIEEQIHTFEEVIALSNQAIEINKEDPSLWLTISSAQERLGMYDESIQNGIKAMHLCKEDDVILQMVFNNLGYTYSKIEDLTNAEYYTRKAIKLDDKEPYAFNNLGYIFAKCGKIEEGLKLVNHSISLDNSNSYVYKNRAKIYIMLGELEAAKRDLLRAKNMDYALDHDDEVDELLKTI